jgi:Ran GTPase-activating protein (RanGAP) involved in mRNA processing and transport
VSQIVKILESHSRVRKLNISGNYLSDDGIRVLASVKGLEIISTTQKESGQALAMPEGSSSSESSTPASTPRKSSDEESLGSTGLEVDAKYYLKTAEGEPYEELTDEFLEMISKSSQRTVWISGKIGPQGAIKLANALKNKQDLQELYLSRCGIGDDGITVLAYLVDRLETLWITRNEIGPQGLRVLVEAMNKKNANGEFTSRLRILNMGENPIGDEGLRLLAGNETLRELDISACGITSYGTPYLKRTKILILRIGHNEIGSRSLKDFAAMERLEDLDLRHNSIEYETAEDVEALKLLAAKPLRSLCLQDNNIKDGAKVFADSRIEMLYLADNWITDEDITEEYAVNPSLQLLDLNHNSVGYKTAEVLSRNPRLTDIELRRNKLDDKAVECFLKRQSQALVSLKLSGNPASESVREQAEAFVAANGKRKAASASNPEPSSGTEPKKSRIS